jgi:hypothetical protein
MLTHTRFSLRIRRFWRENTFFLSFFDNFSEKVRLLCKRLIGLLTCFFKGHITIKQQDGWFSPVYRADASGRVFSVGDSITELTMRECTRCKRMVGVNLNCRPEQLVVPMKSEQLAFSFMPGQSMGQVVCGGTGSTSNLVLQSTVPTVAGKVIIRNTVYDEASGRLGVTS